MRTTVRLPDELIRAAKGRAVETGRTLSDMIGDALRAVLAREETEGTRRQRPGATWTTARSTGSGSSGRGRAHRGFWLQFLGMLPLLVGVWLAAVPPLSGQDFSVRDSAGIAIVRSGSPAVDQPVVGSDLTLTVQIGSVDGRGGTDFSNILDARLHPDGYVMVVGSASLEIRLFDWSTGALVRSIGRQGDGPGEFRAPPTVAPAHEGGLWAWDPGARRTSLFGIDGELKRERSLAGAGPAGLPHSILSRAWDLSATGEVLAKPSRTNRSTAAGRAHEEQEVWVVRSDEEAPVPIGEAHSRLGVRDRPFVMFDRFSLDRPATAFSAGNLYIAWGEGWEVEVYDSGGRLHTMLRADIPRRPITSGLLAAERARIEEAQLPPEDARRLTALFDRLDVPDSTAAISEIRASDDGVIWVQRWRAQETMETSAVLDAFSPEGRWLRTMIVPQGLGEVVDIAAGRVLTVWHDAFDIPYLRVFRMETGLIMGRSPAG